MHDGAAASGHDARDGAPATARTLSYAEAIREALAQAMETDPRVFLFGEDVGVYGGAFGVSGDLFKRFGAERVIDTPISELSLAGAAIGERVLSRKLDQDIDHAAGNLGFLLAFEPPAFGCLDATGGDHRKARCGGP